MNDPMRRSVPLAAKAWWVWYLLWDAPNATRGGTKQGSERYEDRSLRAW